MEYKGGDLMLTEIITYVFFGLLYAAGFLVGMVYEHKRIYKRFVEVATNEIACCGNCKYFNGAFCTKDWNNLDESFNVTRRDAKDSGDFCIEREDVE